LERTIVSARKKSSSANKIGISDPEVYDQGTKKRKNKGVGNAPLLGGSHLKGMS